METTFTIEEISNGFIAEINSEKRHFDKLDDLLLHAFGDLGNKFDKETKIMISFKIKGVDASRC